MQWTTSSKSKWQTVQFDSVVSVIPVITRFSHFYRWRWSTRVRNVTPGSRKANGQIGYLQWYWQGFIYPSRCITYVVRTMSLRLLIYWQDINKFNVMSAIMLMDWHLILRETKTSRVNQQSATLVKGFIRSELDLLWLNRKVTTVAGDLRMRSG